MDIILIITGFFLILLGITGAFIPVLPGSPLSFLGLWAIEYTFDPMNSTFLWIMGVLAILTFLLDYLVPIWGTRRFGGTRPGVIGATLGMIVGLFFFPPLGIIIGPFIGAYAGEVLYSQKNHQDAFRAAWGSFVGFLLGTGIKLIYSLICLYFAVSALIENT